MSRTYALSTWIFLRVLGVVYFLAFASLWPQVEGLWGSHGIAPAARLLEAVRTAYGSASYRAFPTLAWLASSDAALRAFCIVGMVAATFVALGFLCRIGLIAAFCFYLSLVVIGEPFTSFQWDALLLETGLLAVFLVDFRPLSTPSRAAEPRAEFRLLVLWLLFRLMFSSGWVKLASGDPTWRSLTALRYHYETQPLPTPLGYYAHLLPGWAHAVAAIAMFAVELGAPFLLFLPGAPRRLAALLFVFLQLTIAATGNYGYFNLLTAALTILAIDDETSRSALPRAWRRAYDERIDLPKAVHLRATTKVLAAVFFFFSMVSFARTVSPRTLPSMVQEASGELASFRVFNSYGLFAVMTTRRREIQLEASMDGATWKPYEFKWKPGDPERAPPIVAPHQPRLDWQLWFAALSTWERNPWLIQFMQRLLVADPVATRLLARSPFAEKRPRFVRAMLYDYRFASYREHEMTGAFWKRRLLGAYAPTLGRDGFP